MSTGLIESAWIDISKLAPHPKNPRVGRPDKIDAIKASMREDGYLIEKPMLVRPHGDGYQIIGGHSRFTAAKEAGLDKVLCVVKDMDDDQAILRLGADNINDPLPWYSVCLYVVQNSQKDSKKGLSRAALIRAATGKKGSAAKQEAMRKGTAGEVLSYLIEQSIIDVTLLDDEQNKTLHLSAIHALPASCWSVAVDAMLDKGWSAADTKHWVNKAREFDIPEPWQSVFLPLDGVIAHFLATREFSPATVRRLCAEAERVEAMLAEHEQPVDDWREWLAAGVGGVSWDVRKLCERGREIENELLGQKGEIVWHLGKWQEHIGSLADASITAIVTDPPYGVNYQSDHRLDRRVKRKHHPIANDRDVDLASAQLRDALTAFMPKLKTNSCVFVFCSWKNEAQTREAIDSAGLVIRNSLVWVKNRTGMGDPNTTFAPMHERIIFAVKGSPTLIERLPDVLHADRPDSTRHPTEKPADLIERLINVASVTGDWVADPFGGVASTLVAARLAGRIGWGCEIDSAYHEIGIERLACQHTAQTLKLTGT